MATHAVADTPQEISSKSATEVRKGTLPAYATEMADFHQAFADDLHQLVDLIPLPATARVLDVGSGDGFYTGLLAQRLGPSGCVVALDVNRAFLKLARRQPTGSCRVALVQGKLRDFPAEEKFDVVWCAQSLYSLSEPTRALQDMARLVKPGGIVAILENDTLHHLLFPWPVQLELTLRTAEYAVLQEESPHPDKYYVGRRLWSLLAEAGLQPEGFQTQCCHRHAPLSKPLERFLTAYLHRLGERVAPRLEAEMAREFRSLISPRSSDFLLSQPHFTVGLLNVLAWGRKPQEPAASISPK